MSPTLPSIPTPELATIHITPAAAGKNLAEDLAVMARTSGRNTGDYKRVILTFANKNRQLFDKVAKPRAKGGTHITCTVPKEVAEELSLWNKERNENNSGRGRGALCSFIFEKFIEDNMESLVFNHNALPKPSPEAKTAQNNPKPDDAPAIAKPTSETKPASGDNPSADTQ